MLKHGHLFSCLLKVPICTRRSDSFKHYPKQMWRYFDNFFLQVDFERWKSEDDDEDISDNNFKNGMSKDIVGDYPDLFEKLKKDEFGYRKGV